MSEIIWENVHYTAFAWSALVAVVSVIGMGVEAAVGAEKWVFDDVLLYGVPTVVAGTYVVAGMNYGLSKLLGEDHY